MFKYICNELKTVTRHELKQLDNAGTFGIRYLGRLCRYHRRSPVQGLRLVPVHGLQHRRLDCDTSPDPGGAAAEGVGRAGPRQAEHPAHGPNHSARVRQGLCMTQRFFGVFLIPVVVVCM
jgi:hypothetical protein